MGYILPNDLDRFENSRLQCVIHIFIQKELCL